MNLHFDILWAAVVAAVLPVLSALTYWFWHTGRLVRLTRLGGEAAVARLAPTDARRAPVARAARMSAVLGLAMLAYAGPRWGNGSTIVHTEGIDVVLAIDASLSMLAEDERPSRLERLKQDVRRFRAAAPGDRVALLAFAGKSYILTPLTSDQGAIELYLDNLDPSVVGQAGSALEPTIRQGVDLLKAAKGAAGRALVILTDGEAFDDRAATLSAASSARDAEISIVTVGYGTEEGTSIPVRDGANISAKRDNEGTMVITKYNPLLLRDIARIGNGEFIPANATDKGARIHQALSRLDAKQRDIQEGLSRPLRLTWLLLPALLLLLLDSWRADGGSFSNWRRLLRLSAPLILLALFAHSASAQSSADAIETYKMRRFAESAKMWRQRIAAGDVRPVTLFNLGTALLAADSLVAASEALERAALSPDPALRQRALYNLGLTQLKRGSRADNPDASRAISAAVSAYRTLLLQRPDDADARWNYELAMRIKQQQGGAEAARTTSRKTISSSNRPDNRSRTRGTRCPNSRRSSCSRRPRATKRKRKASRRKACGRNTRPEERTGEFASRPALSSSHGCSRAVAGDRHTFAPGSFTRRGFSRTRHAGNGVRRPAGDF